jgi:alginate O-acetyltransferase complex protein AlgI
MLFNSLEFLLFFPLVVAAYFLLPHRLRWVLLLVASYWFYMAWKASYAILLVTTTMVAWAAALGMDASTKPPVRRAWLVASLIINFGLLFTFKYFNLFADTADWISAWLGHSARFPHLDVLLPVGISFYTFQTLSYSIDVYRGDRPSERHFGIFALYVSFFPQLVAGPIERSTTLLPQLRKS